MNFQIHGFNTKGSTFFEVKKVNFISATPLKIYFKMNESIQLETNTKIFKNPLDLFIQTTK